MIVDRVPVGNLEVCASFTIDIMEFCFAQTIDTLKTPGFRHPLLRSAQNVAPMVWIFKHFPLMKHLLLNILDWVAMWLTPEMSGMLQLKNVTRQQVDAFLRDPERMVAGIGHEVIYHRLLGVGVFATRAESDREPVVPQNINRQSLYDEAQTLVLAGSETVGNTLAVGTFYILNTPGVMETVKITRLFSGGILREREKYRCICQSYVEIAIV